MTACLYPDRVEAGPSFRTRVTACYCLLTHPMSRLRGAPSVVSQSLDVRAYVVEVLEELKPEDVVTEARQAKPAALRPSSESYPVSLVPEARQACPSPLVQILPSFLSTCWRAPLGVCGLGYGC